MNKKILYKQIVIRLIHFVLAIIVAAVVAGLIAFFTTLITKDVETIVITSLIGVWIAEITLYILRCKALYSAGTKIIAESPPAVFLKKSKSLKKRYAISTTIFSIVFGWVLYNMKNSILLDIAGSNNNNHLEASNDNLFFVKMGIVFVLFIALGIRMFIRRRHENNIEKINEEKPL